jgi:hypothetical protein
MDKTIFEFGKNSSRLEKGPKKKTMFGFNVMGFGGGGPKTYKVGYLVLAGGGAGSARHGPGGGGGGMRNSDNKNISCRKWSNIYCYCRNRRRWILSWRYL